MGKRTLFTIGHGNRKAEDFLHLLQEYGINYLVDVRSKPYSRFHTQFRREALKSFLESNGIRYVFMGENLGGRPEAPSCYTPEGRVDYAIVATKEFFKEGIQRLVTAYEKGVSLALMCAERDPSMCHRSRLIGKALDKVGIPLQHIDEKGKLKTQEEVMGRISKAADQNLFSDER